MKSQLMKRSSIWLLLFFICSLAALAQTSRGTVSGLVADQTGAVIPGATITLTQNETGVIRTTVTNNEGLYRFDAVELGTYTIKISASNFGVQIKSNINVSAGQVAQVDAQLQPGAQELSVDVTTESGALLQTEAPVRGGNIETQRITQLPFASRNPVSLALTLPGVSSNRNGFGSATFSVNGGRGRSNNFLIDGTENNDISVAGQGFQITNPDAVKEVSVQTSNYDAEFGRAGGAVVNTITKSGTNDWHGTAAFLYDTTADDALTSQQSRDPNNVLRGRAPSGTQNIYSGTIGGPLRKNRTFVFGSYQQDRQRSTSQTQLTTLTAAGRTALRTLFPSGANSNVDLLLNATQNAVATSDPFDQALGSLAGGPNRGNIQFGTFFRNYAALSVQHQWQVRVDHQLSEKDQLSGRMLSDRQNIAKGGIAEFEGFDADYSQRLYNLLLTETHVFSSTLTNEARLAYNRLDFGFPLADPSGPAGQLPRITITNLSSLGMSTTFPQGRIANNYTFQDTITNVRGNHTIRAGVDLLRQISRQAAPFNPRGSLAYTTSTGFTAFANFVDNFGGASGTAARDFGSAIYFPSMFRTAVFAQDRWRKSDALTLTLGVRYEYFGRPFNTLRTPAFTDLFNVDPVTRTGPYSQPNKVRGDWNNWAPTIGVAYSPGSKGGLLGRLLGDKKTVIRTGYQIGYDSFFNNIASNAATSSPNVIATSAPSNTTFGQRGLGSFSTQIPTTAAAFNPLNAQTLIQQNLVNPYYQRWSLGIQRELPGKLVVDASYVGSKGTKLYINEDWNPVVPANLRVTPPGYTGPTQGRLDNLQGARTVRTNGGWSNYHSGQLSVQRRFSKNITVTGAYTYSKMLDNASEVFAAGGTTAASVFALPHILGGAQFEKGPSLFDRTHRATFTYVYDFPWMREQNNLLGKMVGGWQWSGVITMETGVPFSIFNGLDSDGIGGGNERPTFNPNGQKGVRAIPVTDATGRITGYTNPDNNNAPIDPATARYIVNPAFNAALANSVQRFGTLGRNTERTPGTHLYNMNFLKRTNFRENLGLEVRAEFYNIFNRPNYTQASVSPFSPLGGTLSSNANAAIAGRFLNPNTPTSDGGGRVVRYNVKLIF